MNFDLAGDIYIKEVSRLSPVERAITIAALQQRIGILMQLAVIRAPSLSDIFPAPPCGGVRAQHGVSASAPGVHLTINERPQQNRPSSALATGDVDQASRGACSFGIFPRGRWS